MPQSPVYEETEQTVLPNKNLKLSYESDDRLLKPGVKVVVTELALDDWIA